jgi:hypothetical protein
MNYPSFLRVMSYRLVHDPAQTQQTGTLLS